MKRHHVARTIGGLLIAGGAAFLAGWILRIPFWDGLAPTRTLMVAATAACFALSGIALTGAGSALAAVRVLRLLATWAMAAVAATMLLQAVLATDLGIDFPDLHSWYRDNNPHPGRMAPNTAIAFLMAAVALQLRISGWKGGILFHALPAAVVTMGLVGLVGYTFLFDLAYGWYDIPRMAVTTAVGMILLGSGLIADQPPRDVPAARTADLQHGADDDRGYAFLGIAVTILAMVVFVSYGSIRSLVLRTAWVEHTSAVRIEFEMLAALEAKAYNAWRTYLAAGDQQSLNDMRATGTRMLAQLEYLESLTADNSPQQERLKQMHQLVNMNMTLLSKPGPTPVGSLLESMRSKETQTAVLDNRARFESVVEAFRVEESRLLAERQSRSSQSVAVTIWVIFIGNAIGFAILFYAGWQLKRQNDLRGRILGALQESYAFLDSLIEHIPNMVFVKDAKDLRFVRFNRAGEALLGIPRGELIGKSDYDMFPRSEADFFTSKDRVVLSGSDVVEIAEESIHTRNKGVRILHTAKIPILDEKGNSIYLLGISEDITERKQTEHEIAALNTRLAARASELESANKELESFTYSVSHDLRAPLRAINGYALMLEEDYQDKLDDSARRYITQMRQYSRQMGDLIDDLLRLSRFGRQALKLGDLDMNRLVGEVVTDETKDARWGGAEVTIDSLPRTCADSQLLRLVWANLICNALKYSSKSAQPAIRIGGYVEGQEAIYFVKDNGVGFDMTYYEKLFSVFQRLHRSDEFPGTGVGLAIAHRIVVRHGGRIWAKSEINRGATFFFALPMPDSPFVENDEATIGVT